MALGLNLNIGYRLIMPRKYDKKSLRATNYTQEDLNAALKNIAKGERSQYAAAKHYRIPVSTLNDMSRL